MWKKIFVTSDVLKAGTVTDTEIKILNISFKMFYFSADNYVLVPF